MSIVEDGAAVAVLPDIARTRHVPAPRGPREPLKVSVYERMSKSNAQLMPIFPYDGAGVMVPCGAMLYGGEDRFHGHFFHWNTVSELLVAWGSNEAMIPTGSLMATQPFHGVNSFLRDEKKDGAFALVTITQRQSAEAGQREALTAKCEKCRQDLVKFEYASAPEGTPDYDPNAFGDETDVFPQFSTQWGSQEFVKARNSDEVRTCKNCGHENYWFDQNVWGWDRLYNQTKVSNAAYHALATSAKEVLG
ncbi:hypothetical protein [Microbacterium sp. Root61]|uniref:hypothetical protein n=1 Tax=Microbacterium sp. Root61 TaxID=1736570 RepID=UPI000A798EC0|nr:hypothetical protein [Microbacterium sp. Root61]